MQTCDVSVVIPAYNAERFIVDALNSIARQTLLPAEVIVINDGSTDGTSAVVQQWINLRQGGFPVCLVDQDNKGVPGTRNAGIRRAGGKWIALLDSDDIWEACHLEALFRGIEVLPTAIAAYGAGRLLVGNNLSDQVYDDYWDNPSQKFGIQLSEPTCFEINSAILPRLIKGNFIKPSSLMFVKSIANDIGLFNEGLRNAEDREFLVRLIHEGVFVYNSLPITQYRWHDENISQPKNTKRNLENALRALRVIDHRLSLKQNAEAVATCRVEIKELVKGYLFSCSQLGLSGYIAGLGFIAKQVGVQRAVNALSPKDIARSILMQSYGKIK